MGGSITVDSTPGSGSVLAFELKFDLASTQREATTERFISFEHAISDRTRTDHPVSSTVPSGTDLSNDYRDEAPLQFLVVDDNELNKVMFERTVNNMFKKKERIKPVYTFAADGLYFIGLAI
jgi:hypothetical protein